MVGVVVGETVVAERKLPTRVKVFWGIGQIGEGVKNAAFNSFLLFYYNQILGVSATLTSIALAIAILFDALSDPIVGSVSDRFQSQWGRRHPFILASSAPLGITLFLLFFPPDGMSEMFYFGWILLFAVSVRTFLTLYQIPHLALGAELATGYTDRNALFSYGLLFGAAAGYGFYFGMLTFVFPPQLDLPNGMYNASGFPKMAAAAGVIAFSAIILCVWGTRSEIPRLMKAVPSPQPFGLTRVISELKVAFSSPSYRSIFFGLLMLTTVVSIEAAFTPFMGIHFWGLETDQLRLIPVGVLVGLPFGSVLAAFSARKIDKKWCLISGCAVTIISVNVLIVLRLLGILPDNGHWSILPMLIIAGFGAAVAAPVIYITINSMFADITDELELVTGERQEGIVYSARAFAGKAAVALGTVIGGLALDFIAFPKNAVPGLVHPDVIFNLGLFQGPATSVFSLLALLLFLKYALSREKHRQIVYELERSGLD
ncbi:MFS transporter [Gammaproteobacteria bacterium]|nr:MFS transporter [Gammaproteobacteria bacterium]